MKNFLKIIGLSIIYGIIGILITIVSILVYWLLCNAFVTILILIIILTDTGELLININNINFVIGCVTIGLYIISKIINKSCDYLAK